MDDRSILVRRDGQSGWSSPEMITYRDEAHLQDVLLHDPARVPGVSAEAVTAGELHTVAGYLDVCCVDVDGSVTVVECKLASNSEKRRMVLGQVVDYAAAIWQDGPDAFLALWERHTGVDLSSRLTAEALEALRRNITDGRIHLCLAVDEIDADMRRLIEFLNQITTDYVTVTALQLRYARHGDVEILVPSTFGGELAEAKSRTVGRSSASWSWDLLAEAVTSDTDRALLADLRARAEGSCRPGTESAWFGKYPGGWVYLHPKGASSAPLALWANKAGVLLAYGTWSTYTSVPAEVFAPVAAVLGQSVSGPAKGVPLASVDPGVLWSAMVEVVELLEAP